MLRFHASSAASFEDAGGDFTRYASKFEDRRDASVFFRSDADNARGLKKLLGEKLYDELIEVIR